MNHKQASGGVPFPDEIIHLSETGRQLDDALKSAEADVLKLDREYRDAKQYMMDYRGETDPHEMFQNELLLKQTDRSGSFAVTIRDTLVKLMDSPYFARIDFQGEGDGEPEKFYIGRFSFSHEGELLVLDWRAPIAGVFYEYDVGRAGYDAPMGRIDGTLTRKRQFKIRNGVLEYAIESSSHVQDEILQMALSQASDEKMKSIITTIQKEQNQIIRNEKKGTLIIQGVAGSGKTSIALHRIAFLLYRLKERLHAQNVTILSPSKVFGDYIGGVIPELGEEPVNALSFSEIAALELEGLLNVEPEKDPLEIEDENWAERVRYKSTMEFLGVMNDYIDNLPNWIFSPKDIACGEFTATGDWIWERFLAYGKQPVKRRLSMIADDIYHHFQSGSMSQDGLPRPRIILKSLTAQLNMKNTLALYKAFYKRIGKPQMFVMPAKKMLEWADVWPFLYLQAAFEGIKKSGLTKHLVIDEMQDYTPVQYALLNQMFPCQKTILGDFGQSMNPCHTHTLADLRRIYEGAAFVELNKSYRSTYEIMTFAKNIQNISELNAIERHGEEPALISCGSGEEELQQVKKAILAFEGGGSASLGIILKTNKAANALYERLKGEFHLSLITPNSTRFTGGVSVTSIRLAKGLEFDEVLLPQADGRTYASEVDRSLLYIACTRAMHRLTLLYSGEPSPFLPRIGLRKL